MRTFPLVASLAAALSAQSNVIPGRDLRLATTWQFEAFQRAGTWPDGLTAAGAWTTCCNPGTSPVPFEPAMSPNHAFIHFLVARLSEGRLVQIANQSWVKHTFGSSNDPSVCGSCAGPGNFFQVEVGCSDTYASWQAVDHFWLGPPDEIDPWLGTWVPVCSHFDRGEPPGPPATACDGIRSLDHGQAGALNATVNHQLRMHDADLAAPGTFWWQAGYLIPAEAEALRDDNIGSRQFLPTWDGSNWVFADGPDFLPGTILQRWPGASISSATNGADDGRFFVAVTVSGPHNGLYHYEYGVHNRDNKRGLGAFRLPICPQARVSGFGFHDADRNAGNDWAASVVGSEIVFATTTNPARWNTLFNFWFDTDAAPHAGTAQLDAFDPGPGAATVAVATTTPSGIYNLWLGAGCGSPAAPELFATGSPDRAAIPNASFALRATGNPAGVPCGFVGVDGTASLLAPGCTLYSSSLAATLGPWMLSADGNGEAVMPMAVPPLPVFEGTSVAFQMANIAPGGAALGAFNLSNGLLVRVGNALNACP